MASTSTVRAAGTAPGQRKQLDTDVDMVVDIVTATATAADTAWIAVLQDVDTTGGVSDVTAAIMEFRHAPVATSTTNAISSASRLLFPVLEESDGGLDA